MSGVLHLVGTGPGDPELLTLKAARIISRADILAFPVGSETSLARAIAAPHIRPGTEEMPIVIPMRRERGPARAVYDGAAEAIAAELGMGLSVAYLCEGDPLFYGSAMYLLDRLGDRYPVEIVPGVTSLTAAAAAIARPLAARNDVLKVLPAPLPDDVLVRELASAGSVAIIKLGSHFDRVRDLLVTLGLAEGAMVVIHASTGHEKVLPLLAMPAGERPYFSIILIYAGSEGWAGDAGRSR